MNLDEQNEFYFKLDAIHCYEDLDFFLNNRYSFMLQQKKPPLLTVDELYSLCLSYDVFRKVKEQALEEFYKRKKMNARKASF